MLNKEQQLAYDNIMNSSDRVIVLLGKAGTGKSYLISKIAKELGDDVSVTATTNKAKNLLKASTGINDIRTIHSFCGYTMIQNGLEQYLSKTGDTYYNDIVIVDEVSMLPQNVLNTLLDTPAKKIVLVGDLAQLPSIGVRADISKYPTFYLTQNMRQVNNVELLNYLDKLRECVTSKRVFKVTENTPDSIIIYDRHKDFCKAYLKCESQKRILAYSNSVVDSYNTNINQGIKFKIGDLIVLDIPIGVFRNGDVVEIQDISETEHFYYITILDGSILTVFKSKTYKEQLKYTQPETYQQMLKYIASPKLVYASTIHKAQGDSIDEVFIDISDIYAQLQRKPTKFNNYNQPISVETYLKLVYVAISRMKTKAHLYIGDKRDYKQLRKI